MKRFSYILAMLMAAVMGCHAQLNTDRITAIGRNALYFDDYVLSIQYFNQVIKIKPYLAEPYLYRAIAKIQLGDMVGAEYDCTMAIARSPFMPGAYYTRGFVYRQQNKLTEAEKDFCEALRFAPENKTYLLLRADVYAAQKNYDKALADIDFLIGREPRSASLYFEKGVIALAKEDTTLALSCFSQTVVYDTQNASNWSALGLVNLMIGDENEALANLTKAIDMGSKWAGDYINRGIIYYHKHNYRGALSDYDKAIECDKRNPQCYYNRGLLRTEVGDYNNALDDLNEAIALSDDPTEMYYQRGIIHLQLRQWKDARADFDQVIQQYPYFLPSYYVASKAASAQGDNTAAYRYLHTAAELEKDKEKIQKNKQAITTEAQLADAQPQKRDRRKEFSSRAAQNIEEKDDEKKYTSETRGAVQNNYTDVVNEPNIVLSYYHQPQSLRRTNYFHYQVDALNKNGSLPLPLHFTVQELALRAEMVNQHFDNISSLSSQITSLENERDKDTQTLIALYFRRAIEFALVQDYSSAIDDCTRSLQLSSDQPIVVFCRANWRYKQLEYQRAVGDWETNIKVAGATKWQVDYELMLRDYDEVIRLLPDLSFAYYNKANMLCMQKSFDAAIEMYTSAIEHDPDFAEAYFNRGLTYIYTDRIDEGLADLSKAGELGIYQAYNLIARFK